MAASKNCPDAMTLAAFADGRVSGAERTAMVRHVNGCERCFAIYSDALAFAGQSESVAPLVRFAKPWRKAVAWSALAAAALLLLTWSISLFRKDPTAWRQADWWRARYGEVSADHPLAMRANGIFSRVAQTVEGGATAKLILVENRTDMLALALPGQGIVLSLGALQSIYAGSDPALGDSRLALVLGHELTHFQLNEDLHGFSDFEFPQRPMPVSAANPSAATLYEKELRADQRGLIYAAQAGFDPQTLWQGSESFFHQWLSRPVAAAAYSSHPDPAARAHFLKDELVKVAGELDYFHYGLRYFQIGRFEEARWLLTRFRAFFAGREVLNNLGLVELQIALGRLAECDGSLLIRFKLPLELDPTTAAASIRRGGESFSDCYGEPVFREHLDTAVSLFEEALALDPKYLPSRVNLFSARVAGNEVAAAMVQAAAIAEQEPGTPETRSLEALALFLFAVDKDLPEERQEALAQLQQAMQVPSDATWTYNLAAMLEATGADASMAWRAFLAREKRGPFADYARERVGEKPSPRIEPDLPEPPVPLGPIGAAGRARLAGMIAKEMHMEGEASLIAYRDPALRVLVAGDRVVMVEERLAQPLALATLEPVWFDAREISNGWGKCLVGEGLALEIYGDSATRKLWFVPLNAQIP